MEAGSVATVAQETEKGGLRVILSRIVVLSTGLFLVLNSLVGAFPGFLFGQFGSRLHVAYAVMSKLGMDCQALFGRMQVCQFRLKMSD